MSILGRPGFVVPHYRPVISSSSSVSVSENQTAALTVVGVDPDPGAVLAYSVVGGADQAKFSIGSSSGVLTFNTAPNFEVPTDSDANNVYVVTVRVTSQGETVDQTISVTVINANEAPLTVTLSANTIAENSAQGTTVGTLGFTDPDAGATGTFSLTDSAGSRFQVTGTTLQAGPVSTDFESATSHSITVRFTDQGGLFKDQAFTINVTDVFEVTPGSSTFDSGTSSFVIPNYNVLTIEAWGQGAGGSARSSPAGLSIAGTAGAATTCSSLGMTAGGGNASATGSNTGGTGGAASGGNNVNTNGSSGGNVTTILSGSGATGFGAASPNGGAQVGPQTVTNTTNINGQNGNGPGGGGEGGGVSNGPGSGTAGQGSAGGGSGAYVKTAHTHGGGGSPAVGASLSYSVGTSGGAGANSSGHLGGNGAPGRIKFTWS